MSPHLCPAAVSRTAQPLRSAKTRASSTSGLGWRFRTLTMYNGLLVVVNTRCTGKGGAAVELSPEREDELVQQVLRDQVGIDPHQLRPILELAALGLVSSAWRNTSVENWHAAGRLHDGDMLRINSHASWRVRQLLSRWRTEMGLGPDALAESLDEIDSEDFRWLAGRIYQWVVNPHRRLRSAGRSCTSPGPLIPTQPSGSCQRASAISAMPQISGA